MMKAIVIDRHHVRKEIRLEYDQSLFSTLLFDDHGLGRVRIFQHDPSRSTNTCPVYVEVNYAELKFL
jgi:hypothetical protein